MIVDAPEIRIREANQAPVRGDGDYVLYWMIANRRADWNFSLDRAVAWSKKLAKPLVVLEALRTGYRWASDRIHQFVIEGMADNAEAFAKAGVTYYPYLEPAEGAGAGLLEDLAKRACVVVTDEFPCFFLPRMVATSSAKLSVSMEVIDSNGIYPLRDTEIVFSTAHQFRRHLQKRLPSFLSEMPSEKPFQKATSVQGGELPSSILKKWPMAKLEKLASRAETLSTFPINHRVEPSEIRGGSKAAKAQMHVFLESKLARYGEDRNQPDKDVASGLSPYLHFGHVSVHEIFHRAVSRENWSPSLVNSKAHGSRTDWWRTSAPLESFLDELITWRELGYHFCAKVPNYDQFESLPGWAKATLLEHAGDPRTSIYSLEQFETARTHDPLWNAAQRQLLTEGKIHNYLRMLWGKKILEWSPSPQAALEVMIELNNKYALDGRNPNSYSGIFWTLGRFDRAWGPERPVYGTIRYMSSDNTGKKLDVKQYLKTYSDSLPLFSRRAPRGES